MNELLPDKYKAVLHLDYSKYRAEHPSKHPPMSNAKRAAQFSAFKALGGHGSHIL